ncbi:P pilus assembly/Cpx signaling pathway, periplasmic inhibitor/zinc-resistance associated protein [Rivularia sp. PCC 7116]|uniref:pilus assembly protein n=1 Tax=Rivularia sp. PCC 7116 TaxID=373994 RepID=UPI00029EE25F|nr:pilus assembly protein [Rivularia sp. PCC 7116]AFY55578.1 P pilus assembly/Cpx signaling pathway, periplasmic inhibitor/zinc-resistance associated protein [Rivularia sp. PCC 7116]
MKLKKLSLLAGAIAVAFSITPLAVNAQVNNKAPQRVSQAKRPPSPSELKLTQEQMKQINEILSNRSTQMQNVLTQQQRQKIQTDLKAGKNPREVFASIDLSKQQEGQLRTIALNSQKRIEAVLTTEQKNKIKKWQAEQQGQRQQQQPKK